MRIAINIRIDEALNSYLRALTEDQNTDFTHTVEALLHIGLENRKDAKILLERKRILALDSLRFEEADLALHIELKKAYTVENFRKLLYKIKNAQDMSRERKEAVLRSMFQRIEDVLGRDSPEYQECERISHQKKREEGTG